MAKRTPPPTAATPALADSDVDACIARLRSRLEQVEKLSPNDDTERNALSMSIRNAIHDIFGTNSQQWRSSADFSLTQWMFVVPSDPDEYAYAKHEAVTSGMANGKAKLRALIAELEERKAEQTGSPGTARREAADLFDGLTLHARIRDAARELFKDGHYRQAVLDASLAFVNMVKERSRVHDRDGNALMSMVFSRNNPILAVNDLADQSDQDEQEGFMHLAMGVCLALRNPRAHDLDPDEPEHALDCLVLLSMLAKRVQKAQRRAEA
jgi:uncharacterized protein (TIGR02391 family)